MLAPVGLVSAASAAEPGSVASSEVDRIFAENLPGNRTDGAPAAAPAPAPANPPAPKAAAAPAARQSS
ncbi:MAG TPA: hypothetical protein VHL54_12185, partial [Actinomycetota bacterium]|nr:hypothetical protein [Actinomycetota bacterium]